MTMHLHHQIPEAETCVRLLSKSAVDLIVHIRMSRPGRSRMVTCIHAVQAYHSHRHTGIEHYNSDE